MFPPQIFNTRNQYQRLATLIQTLPEVIPTELNATSPEEETALRVRFHAGQVEQAKKTEEYLQRASSVLLTINRLAALYHNAAKDFAACQRFVSAGGVSPRFWSPEVVEMTSHAVSALNQLRVMQNSLHWIVRSAFGGRKSLAKSLSEAHPNLERAGFPPVVAGLIRDYWITHGVVLKSYRDIDQHYFLVANTAVYRLSPPAGFSLLLPDSYEKSSNKAATFAKEIDSLNFINEHYNHLHRCMDECLKELGLQPSRFKLTVARDLLPLHGQSATLAVALLPEGEPCRAIVVNQTPDRRLTITPIPWHQPAPNPPRRRGR